MGRSKFQQTDFASHFPDGSFASEHNTFPVTSTGLPFTSIVPSNVA